MKYVGFLSEHEFSVPQIGKPLKEMYSPVGRSDSEIATIVSYLSNGTKLISFLRYISSEDNEPIGPYEIFTDGKWIWPSYYVFYIKKKNLIIPEEFLKEMESRNFQPPKLSIEELKEVERYYANTFSKKQ